MASPLSVLILAAGEGTRMRSETPKVLHPIAGQPMIVHVLSAVKPLHPRQIGVVIGHGGEQVREVLRQAGSPRLHLVVQRRQRGSGDAVKAASAWLRRQGGDTLVLYGDAPLLRPET
ncbi:MAG: NTP transferase domain-containing protein, partial [Elusimicrobia bacterium]|nr:NTP transferase domain-containing protein [Elusimicrobiota bacterium]